MSKVISLFVAFVCALLIVNVYGQGDDTILGANGAYNPKSILSFQKILKKMKDFTLPAGDAMLEKWIAALSQLNTHLEAGDFKAVENVAHATLPVLRGILPAIPDPIVHAAIKILPEEFEQKYEKSMIDGTATLADMNKFFQFASHTMLDAMSKGTPTPETLA